MLTFWVIIISSRFNIVLVSLALVLALINEQSEFFIIVIRSMLSNFIKAILEKQLIYDFIGLYCERSRNKSFTVSGALEHWSLSALKISDIF